MSARHYLVPAAYLGSIALANIAVATFGPIATPINAFVLIGLDLTCRDALHEWWRGRGLWPRMGLLILAGSILSATVYPASLRVSIASAVAFAAAGVVDTLVYSLLGEKSRVVRVNGSNIFSAAVDSIIFPTLAFGAWMPLVSGAQWIAKVGGGAVWLPILSRLGVYGPATKAAPLAATTER